MRTEILKESILKGRVRNQKALSIHQTDKQKDIPAIHPQRSLFKKENETITKIENLFIRMEIPKVFNNKEKMGVFNRGGSNNI